VLCHRSDERRAGVAVTDFVNESHAMMMRISLEDNDFADRRR
jgi:hypothetical protein